ncbi:Subtilisin-like protease SBT5.4 [Linum grandiflorum]
MGFQTSDLVYALLVSFLFQTLAFGAQKNYIVYLGSHSHGGISELSNTDAIAQAVTESHYNLLGSVLGSEKARDALGYSYKWHINGFSAMLEEEEAAEIAKNPRVVSVFLDKPRKLHTTRSWDYMALENHGAESSPGPLWEAANFGEGTIIATLDTGVWPESKSFDDEGYGPVPSKWKGICQNNTKAGVHCNRKLIGARFFNKGYVAYGGERAEKSFVSARDTQGHGTHTLSTAGGNFIPHATMGNFTAGTSKGGSPKARVAAYKVCWAPIDGNGCFDTDIMAAFDAAINDGVDVISLSVGGQPENYFEDGIAIGSFHAVQKGIVVACSAGNAGPAPETVSNVAPWITTVAASTLDRKLTAFVQLQNGLRIEGRTLTGSTGKKKTYPLRLASEVRAANVSIRDALLCKHNTLNPKKAKGKILACLRGVVGRLEMGQLVASAVLFLQPDITAPGVDIFASWTEMKGVDARTIPFNIISGTSMSCPHVAGVLGLLRTIYPNWSPAALRSAIMTTARTRDNTGNPIKNYLMERATPFSYGSGHIRPNQAMNPGLVYDITPTDYLNFLCASGYNKTQLKNFTDTPFNCPEHAPSILDLNYPSISIPELPSTGSITVTRKLKNVGKPGKYAVAIKEPKGVSISVKPRVLKFKKEGEEKKFKVTLKAKWVGLIMRFQRSVLVLLLSFLFQTLAYGAQQNYIVYLGPHSDGGFSQLSTNTDATVQAVTESHYNLLGSVLGSERARDSLGYSYTWNINGFSAKLEEEEAAEIAKNPRVVSVFLDRGRKLHTTRSWDFMSLENHRGAESTPGSLWKAANYGEGTIIATLDSGVWPESKSFNDEGYGPVPSKWKGFCQNDTKDGVPCNRKLIGARYFVKGYVNFGGNPADSFVSARDSVGHGTHTLSTAGGNFIPHATMGNFTAGTAKGGSPRARVAAYKVCWPAIDNNECFDSDILAGFDAAIHDGVDVISVSLGGDSGNYFDSALSIGSFHAVQKGIAVACSAGNAGPIPGTVTNVAPWVITVAASTMDRKLDPFVQLQNGLRIKGKTLTGSSGEKKMYPLRLASEARAWNVSISDAFSCKNNTLDPNKAKGKILVCLRGEADRFDMGLALASAGAAGMILCNDELGGDSLERDPHYLPALHITYKDSLALFKYINSTKDPHAYISPTTELNVKPAPVMGPFSSTGPNTITPQILKPDITAPGVDIFASWTEKEDAELRTMPFKFVSGTSMSCPHVAGVFGLLRTVYPTWSPAAIRSAIMTTAHTRDNTRQPIRDSSMQRGTPFNYGSGHIMPNHALNPGLVYDLTETDYLNFLCATGYNRTTLSRFTDTPYNCPQPAPSILDLNYPSIAIPTLPLKGSITVTRKLKNVGKPGKYVVSVKEPKGVSISVMPNVLTFDKVGEEKEFKLTVKAKWDSKGNEYSFGAIGWTDGVHRVRSPVAVSLA